MSSLMNETPPSLSSFTNQLSVHELYKENQQRLAAYIQRTRSLLSSIEQLSLRPSLNIQLLYPVEFDPTSSSSSSSSFSLPSPSTYTSSTSSSTSVPNAHPSFPPLKVIVLDLPNGTSTLSMLPKSTLSELLLGKFTDIHSHLSHLETRILDKTCRILVTGDLNAGKSTWINALLRRSILPMDQQPLTNCFIEVLSSHHNHSSKKEQVHAYVDFMDPTFTSHPMHQLYDLVSEGKHALIRVFCSTETKTTSSSSSSLTRTTSSTLKAENNQFSFLKEKKNNNENGNKEEIDYEKKEKKNQDSVLVGNELVDVRLIDSPGLNRDVIKTMALFRQQKEIDVIVFVVSAENHFTLSSREFLMKAGEEKAYIFVIVNKFDAIQNKKKCKQLILEQIQQLSPHTYAQKDQLVHFICSSCSSPSTFSSSSSSLPKLTSSMLETPFPVFPTTDFQLAFLDMEEKLKAFTLEKRSIAKLLPAKRFLASLLFDFKTILDYNMVHVKQQVTKLDLELQLFGPSELILLEAMEEQAKTMQQLIQHTCQHLNGFIQSRLMKLPERLLQLSTEVPFLGFTRFPSYLQLLNTTFLNGLQQEIEVCQELLKLQLQDVWQQFASQYQLWFQVYQREWQCITHTPLEDPWRLPYFSFPETSLTQVYPIQFQGSWSILWRHLFMHSSSSSSTSSSSSFHSPFSWSSLLWAPFRWMTLPRPNLTSSTTALSDPRSAWSLMIPSSSATAFTTTSTSVVTSLYLLSRSFPSTWSQMCLETSWSFLSRRWSTVASLTLLSCCTYVGYRTLLHWSDQVPTSMAFAFLHHLNEVKYMDLIQSHVSSIAKTMLMQGQTHVLMHVDHHFSQWKQHKLGVVAKLEEVKQILHGFEEVNGRVVLLEQQVQEVKLEV